MREKAIELKLRKVVEQAGGVAIKYPATLVAGFPDRIILMPNGRVSFVEVKAPGKKPTAIQQWWHTKLIGLGFKVYVIDSVEQIKEVLE